MTNDVMRIICLLPHVMHFCVFTQRVYTGISSVVISGAGDTEPVTRDQRQCDHRLFLWRVLLVGVRQRRKIFVRCFSMLVAVCSPGTMSLYGTLSGFFPHATPANDVIPLR